MKSTGYHFRIISAQGEVKLDSKNHRINRFSQESTAENIGLSTLSALRTKARGTPEAAVLLTATVETYEAF